ncbi:SgcJ/EcaC family oxidoreductase [Amycolatopsis sp. QT-25]|uniref:SgcJ/EcaC family oxidoreductase n=1 Tax=Amycolatopsis sp. QT-25 TaxID=3034022 RepID=UPI0023EACB3C|nr:SgcJ/EcaC family oxidoreductase [Amycolatopsis sp. QT-25]WET82518.1 SgcJ/EcaC family oxidoreductase [Amycolatopsis sp. QT-25]
MTTTDLAADQAAITGIPQRLVAAWAAHDAAAFARLFTTDGTMILPGVYCKGTEAIRAHMENSFARELKGTRVTGQPVDLRIDGALAVLVTQGGVLASGETEPAPERAIRATWVAVKTGGEWLLAAYQNSPRDVPAPA